MDYKIQNEFARFRREEEGQAREIGEPITEYLQELEDYILNFFNRNLGEEDDMTDVHDLLVLDLINKEGEGYELEDFIPCVGRSVREFSIVEQKKMKYWGDVIIFRRESNNKIVIAATHNQMFYPVIIKR